MAIPRITSDYAYMSDSALKLKADTIVAAMTGNPDFTTPVPALLLVTGSITAYNEALVAAQMRDRVKVAIKNEKKQELIEILRALGNYVTQIAEGNTTIMTSSGFTLAKTGEPVPPITNPQGMKVENGLNPGEVITSVISVPGARSYIHQYTPDPLTPNSQWTSVTSTRCKNLFTGLEPTKIYWFRVAAVGPNDQIAYSEMLSKIVQ